MLRFVSRHSSLFIAGLITLVVLLWLFAVPSQGPASTDQAGDTEALAPPPLVRVEAIQNVKVNSTQKILGITIPNKETTVSSQTSSVVKSVRVEEGQKVEVGEVLATLDVGSRRESLAEAKALLKQRQLELEASLRLEKRGYQAHLEVSQREATLAQAVSVLKQAELEMSHLTVKAPFSGYVRKLHVEIGQLAATGTPIADIIDLSPSRIKFQIVETQLEDAQIGNQVSVYMNGLMTKGQIVKVSHVANSRTRTFEIEAVLKTDSGLLVRAGQTATISLMLQPQNGALVSPASLVLSPSGKLGVKSVNADSRVEFIPVKLIREDEQGAWISGLEDGHLLITTGQGFVDVGVQVRVNALEDSAS